jgi:CubicO group peptidase (beta-lactamase class C family)
LVGQVPERFCRSSPAARFFRQRGAGKSTGRYPGTSYNFSTPGYMALASILERQTNRTWENLASESFFLAQMDGCGFGVQPESSRSAVDNPWPHIASSSGPIPQLPDTLHGDNPSALWPALGTHCTIPSFARFLQIHLDGFHGRPTPILSHSSFAVLQSTWPMLARGHTYGGWGYHGTRKLIE